VFYFFAYPCDFGSHHTSSAAGKILRRELRERAKKELAGRDPSDDNIGAKL
jgi:ribosomal protein S8E